jgi:hypothetical protein
MKVYFNATLVMNVLFRSFTSSLSPPQTNLEYTFSSHLCCSSHHAPPSHQHSQLFDVIKATPSSSFSHTQHAPIHMKLMHDTQHPTFGNQQFRLPNPWWPTSHSRQMIEWDLSSPTLPSPFPPLLLLTHKDWQRSIFNVQRWLLLLLLLFENHRAISNSF